MSGITTSSRMRSGDHCAVAASASVPEAQLWIANTGSRLSDAAMRALASGSSSTRSAPIGAIVPTCRPVADRRGVDDRIVLQQLTRDLIARTIGIDSYLLG